MDNERWQRNADWVREVCGDYVEDWCGNTIADHIEGIYAVLEAERDEALGQLRSIDSEGKIRSLQALIQKLMAERDEARQLAQWIYDHRFSELKGLVTMEHGDFLDWDKDYELCDSEDEGRD